MTTAYQIAQYIRGTGFKSFGEMQRHKLVYYIQGWSLAWDGVPAFDDPIEAWQMGPVIRDLRHVNPEPDSNIELPGAIKATITAVLEYYGAMGGRVLSELAHRESPWLEAWGDRPMDGWGCDPISLDTMRREYTSQSAANRGPHRKPVTPSTLDLTELLDRSRRAREDWSQTLALLAQ